MDPLDIEPSLLDRLTEFYQVRTEKVVEALAKMGPRYYFRVNSLTCNKELILAEISSRLGKVFAHETVTDAGWFAVNERQIRPVRPSRCPSLFKRREKVFRPQTRVRSQRLR